MPSPMPESDKPNAIIKSDEPTVTCESVNIDAKTAHAPITPALRSPIRIAIRPDSGATSENTSGRAMISQPICEVE